MTLMVSFEEFKKLKLRIAEILSAVPHPQADRLLAASDGGSLTLVVPERPIASGTPVR